MQDGYMLKVLARANPMAGWLAARQDECGVQSKVLAARVEKRLGRRLGSNVISMLRNEEDGAPSFATGVGQVLVGALLEEQGVEGRPAAEMNAAAAVLSAYTRNDRGVSEAHAFFRSLAPAVSPRIYRLIHEIFVSGLFGAQNGAKLNRRRKRDLGWGPVPAHLGAWRAQRVRAPQSPWWISRLTRRAM